MGAPRSKGGSTTWKTFSRPEDNFFSGFPFVQAERFPDRTQACLHNCGNKRILCNWDNKITYMLILDKQILALALLHCSFFNGWFHHNHDAPTSLSKNNCLSQKKCTGVPQIKRCIANVENPSRPEDNFFLVFNSPKTKKHCAILAMC